MREKGKVIEINGGRASVALHKKKKGAGCAHCNLCSKNREGLRVLDAFNPAGSKVGDLVDVEIDELSLFKGNLLIFGMPLAGFILGIFFGSIAGPVYFRAAVFLGFFLGFWYYGLNKANEIGRREDNIKITAIYKEREGF